MAVHSEHAKRLRAIIKAYISIDTPEQLLETLAEIESIANEIRATGNFKNPRRWKSLTMEDGIAVYKYVQEHPEASYRKIESACGLSKRCIDNDKNEIFNGKNIREVVLSARESVRFNRFDEAHSSEEVRQMGISSKYQ